MRKLTALIATLVVLCMVSPMAYATDFSTSSAGVDSSTAETSEETQTVYVAKGANLYIKPDTSSEAFKNATTFYNAEIEYSEITADGWVKFWYSYVRYTPPQQRVYMVVRGTRGHHLE